MQTPSHISSAHTRQSRLTEFVMTANFIDRQSHGLRSAPQVLFGIQEKQHFARNIGNMSANPALVQTPRGELVPAPFPGERFLLRRDGVQLDLDAVRTRTGK
eukprot:363378-Chlamydomonas_euryale.AAC.32